MNKLNILIFYFLCGLIILSSQSAKAQGTTCATATALTSGTAVTSQTLTDTAGGSGGDCGSADSATGSSTAGCTYGWYSITAAAAQTIEVALNVTSGATQDARVEIYSGTCAALVLEDCDRQLNTSDALASYITPSSGTYYIRVTDFQCNANVTYEIKATLTDAPCNATTLTSGTAVTGETITDVTAVSGTVGTGNGGDCAASSDNDDYVTPLTDIAATVGCGYKWYSITAATAQTIEVALDVTSGGGTQDVRADLYSGSSCGNLTRITCDRNTDNALLSYIAPTSGTYYIRVTDFACNANITYNIKATLTDAICNATPLSVGTTSGLSLTDVTAVSGTVGEGSGGICATTDYNNPPTGIVGCGYKWYTFSAAANSPIELYLNTATGARLELYSGSTCTSFAPRDCASGTNPAVTYTSATATTYWARVTDTNCDANLSFSLQLNIIQNVLATTGTQTINMDCGTTYNFYDSGGPGGDGAGLYANSLNSNVTFVAPAGQSVRVTFKNVWQGNIGYCATGNGYNAIRIDNGQTGACSIADYLTIYDGAIGSNNLGVYTGTTAFYPSPGTIVSSGNSLSFNFISGASGQEEGWEAVVECVSDISENPTDVTIDCGLGTVFTDNAFNAGGSTNIQPNDQYVVTYCPGTPGYCAFVGSLSGTATLNLNDNSDVLYVYNSDQATGSPIAVLTGGDPNVSNGVACGGAAANSNTITGITAFLANNPNGCLTFKFVSSNSTKDPSWAPRSGWSLPIECVECDLGNGGGTEVGTATSITSNGFWVGTSINDTGNSDSGVNTGCNDAGTDFVLNSTGCLESEITRLENTIWYKLVTPAAMCLANDPILQVNYVNCQNYSSSGSGTNAGNGIQFVLWEMTPGAGNINFTGEGDLWDNNNNGTAVGNNNMIYCEDKVTAGEFVDVPCLKPNTTYYIMVDGFTGQHCFFDMYIDVFPADLTAAPVLSPASGICSGGTFDITQTAKREVEFVWSLTNLTDRNQIYNLSGGSQSLGVGYTSDGVTYTYNDASLPINTGCTPVTYYIYAIDANFPESAGFCGTDYQSAACRPYQMTPIVVYPTPPISNIVTDCSFNIDPNCGAANSNFVVEYSADGVTNWQAESATVPPTPSPSNSFGYWARVRHTSSPSDCGTPVQVFGVGCATTCTIIPPTVFSNSPICAGQTLNLNASTIASATGYSWSGPNGFTSSVQNPSISNATTAATGTYTVTVTNSAIAGCTATATLSVIVNPTPTVSALSIAAICPGTTPAVLSYTASIAGILTVSSGTATINTQTFTVASGAGTVNIAVPTTITNGQTVSVTLTANGCTSTAQTVAIPVHSAPDANFPIPASVCQGSAMSFDGSTSTAGAGTISNYTWIWGDGSANTSSATATTTHTFPASGTYNVSLQITTSNGCVNTETQTVTVVPNPTISNITVTQPTCALATGGVSFNVPTPVTDYEYQIDGGAFTAVAANPTTISSLAVGAHTVTVRRIATPQCTASISFTLVAATGCGATCTAPGMTLTNTSAAFCQSSTTQTASYQYTALANGSTGTPNRYDLTQVFGTTITGATVTNQTLAAPTSNISISVPANTAAGTYTFVLKIYNSSDPTCAAQYPLQLIINPAPTVTLSNNGPVCQGISVTLTASGGTSYSWTGPSGTIAGTTNTQTITPAVAGTYTVVATDANGCTNSATTTVIVNPLPTAAITGTNSICAGSSSIFTATPNGATYAWNTSDATQSIVVTTAGTYTVTVTNSNNCSNVTTRTLTVLTAPDANFTTNSPQCQGATINFDGSSSTAGSGTITAYSWNFGDGTTGTGSTSTHNYGASAVGTYQVSLTITTSNGCTNVQTGTVVINPTPIASITGTTTVCQIGTGTPTTTTITANGGSTYDWSNIVGTDDGATNAGVGAGTYTVTVTSAAGCSSTAAITVTSTDCTGAANCIVDAGPDPANFCVGTSSSVNLNATPAASGSSGTWTCLGCPATPTFGSATSAATTASGLTATGTYTFVWTVTGATCNGQDNAVVTVYPTPVAPVASGSTYCQGQTITAITATGQTGATFTWYSDVALTSVIDNDATYTPTGAGIVYVTQTLNGCQSPATAVTTTVNPNPTPSFTTDSPACLGEAIVFTNTTTGATSYLWAFGDGTNSTQTSPSHTYTSAGTYTVTITATSANGCVASTTSSVVVNALPIASIAGDNTLCVGEDLLLTASGGTSYSWTTPTVASSANPYTVASVTTANAGNYIVTVTDANSCTATTSLPVTVNLAPTALIGGTLTVCSSGSPSTTTLTATGGDTYLWNPPISTNASVTVGAGTYSVTVTNSATGRSSASSVTVSPISCGACTTPVTTANAGADDSQCLTGGTYTLAGNTPTTGTGLWSIFAQPNGGTAVLSSPTAANSGVTGLTVTGDYIFAWTISDPAGVCLPSVDYVKITVNPNPIAAISGDNMICAGESTTFTASGGVSYLWNTTDNTASITASTAGNYSVVVTDANGCTDTESITLIVNNLPTATIVTNSPICAGDDLSLTASGGANYLWTLPNATTASNNPLIVTNATVADAGQYSVTVTDANGCTDTEQANTTINTAPANPVAAGGTYCNVADITAITATGVAAATFTWYSDVNLTTVIDNDATYTPSGAGSVYVTQTVNGCESPATIVTTSITGAPPAPIANDATYCAGENPAALTVLNPATGAVITWYSDLALTNQVGTGTSFDAGTSISTTTTYYVTQTIGSCESSAIAVTINVNPVPAAPSATAPAPYCAGETIVGITATGDLGATYTWYNDVALTSVVGNNATYTPSGAGTFYVTQTVNGCESPATAVTVTVNPNPVPVISGNLQVCDAPGSTTTLTASGGTAYLWNTTDATASISATVGSYTVTVSNAQGCDATATANVIANPLACSPGATISGLAFEETNSYDGLSAGEVGIPNVIVTLYDNNGTPVAQTITNASGTYQFTNVPAGTYTVGFGTPADYTATTPDATGSTPVTDSGDSDINNLGQTQPLTVVGGNNYPNVDGGFVELLDISGTLFGDTDSDGQDNNNTDYPNVTVNLLDSNGSIITTTTTDADGNYIFEDLLPGNYTVQFDLTDTDLPSNSQVTTQNVGSDASDSDINTNGDATVTLPLGQDVSNVDAGITPLTYALTGTVFEDIMADGLQNGADPGIKGVTVFLFAASDLSNPLAVDITNNNGNYVFTDLPPGDYVVMVIKTNTYSFTDANVDPANDIDDSDVVSVSGNNGETAPITITNTNVTNVDAGMFVPAVINGTAFADTDGDNLNDNGIVLSGITVTLTDVNGNPVVDADGNPVNPVITDAAGQYEFTNLLPGDYIVTFGTAPGNYDYIPQGGDSDIDPTTGSFPVLGLESSDVVTVDGGAIQPIIISGTVFTDNNGNGLNDQNTPVVGVTATLYDAATNTVVATTTTDNNGDYTFTGIDPGTYYVDFSGIPSGSTIITPSSDSDANPTTTNTPNVTVSSGSTITDGLDAGIIAPASIIGNVFEDVNYNGLNNENIDVANISVTLFNTNGTPIAATTTDANGNYSFLSLDPGSYYVVFNAGSNYELTTSGGDSDANPLTGATSPITLQSGDQGVFDAGVFQAATISGTVFGDDNADGVAQASDTGESGLQVILYNADGTVATDVNGVPQITTTDINGNYTFDNLLPGDYYVQFNNPAGTQFSPQNLGTNGSDADPTTGQTPTINLTSGEIVTDEDAGVFVPQGVNVSGTVFVDANFNGFQGGTETGVANVPVFLYDAANPLTPIAITATNGAGNYIFTDVMPGNYIVGFGAPANYTYTTPNATPTNDATDSDVTNIAAQQTSSFAVGTTNVSDVDAGLYQLASISGTLFEDMDGDNLNDNNAPVSGVTVVLLDSNGSFVSSTTTDANGNYAFNNIPPGTYTIDFGIIPTGTQFIPQSGDSDVEPVNGTQSVTVPSGGTATVDAGIIQPTTISGTVFGDIDNDGQDDNSVVYPNVTVQLLDENGAVVSTTTTNTSGNYTFTNVLPGDYTVVVNLNDTDLPADFTVSPQNNGNDATDSDINSLGTTSTITVESGTPVSNVDAGIVPATSIAGTVFGDTDFDGQDDNNINIANITVYLYDASNLTTPIATTITDVNGDYVFSNLAPGTYVVQFDLNDSDLPTTAVPTFPDQGNDANDSDMNPSNGFTAPITVTANNPAQNIDAGFYNNSILANDDAETTFINTPVTVAVVLNDVDQQDHAFSVTQVVSQPTHGTAVLNADGTITYTPDFNYTGTDVFTYQICDNIAAPATACDIAIVTITISPDNVVIANPDQDVTLVNTPVTTDPATDNDEDPTNDNFDITEFTQPNNGTVVLNPDNTFTYTPDTDFVGTDVFTYTICDDGTPTACDETTVTIVVNGVNADNDQTTTDQDTPVTIDILNNDEDPNGDNFDITTITDQPNNGTVVINPDGTVTYTPNPGFTGVDVFDYQICDDATPQACDIATVTVTINPVDNEVIANDDFDITNINTPVVVDVFGNDLDPQDDNFDVTTFTQPTNGTVVYNNDGTFTYTPDTDFFGTDVFTYTICDDGLPQACDIATVTIIIPAPTNTVEANNDAETTLIDTPVNISSLDNDNDAEGDNFVVTNFEQPLHGTVTYNPNTEEFTYTPDPGYTGTDVFVYTICDDGVPQACDDAVVTITIDPLPDNTVEANDDATTTEVDTPVDIEVCGNDLDAEGDNFSVTDNGQPLNGTVVYNDDCTFTYTPNPGFSGTDAFTYTICDDGNPQACDEAVVIITIEPQPENTVEANNDETSTEVDTPVDINVCQNDVDAEGNSFTVTNFTQAQNGTVVYNDDCTFTYTPNEGFTGIDVFIYEICDNGNPQACDEAIVIITVEEQPENTVEANDDATTTEMDTPVDIEVCSNDLDAEGDNFVVTNNTQPLNGTVVYNDDCTFTYTPNEGFTGTDVFTYTICDDGDPQACDDAVVIITVEEQPENTVEANDDATTTEMDTPVDIEVCSNDLDAEGDNFVVTNNTQPLNGTVVYNDDCTFTYTPNEGFTGTDVFTYTICDDGDPQACDDAVVIITVEEQPENTVEANDDTATTDENTNVDIEVCSNDLDAEGDNFVVTDNTQPLNGTVVYNDDCTFTYIPNEGFTGDDVFTYTICDDGNPVACDEAVVIITVTGEEPLDNNVIANNDAETTEIDTPVVIDVMNNDTDPEGNDFTVTDFTQPQNGTVTENPDGTLTYLPDPGYSGTDVFTYTICDDGNPVACDEAVVIITIEEQPDNTVIANNDAETTEIDTPVVIDVMNNDTDPEGNDFTVTDFTQPQNGTVTENPDGTLTYLPDPGYSGTDVFTYTICDDGNPVACDEAVVIITIEEQPDNTVIANDDTATTDENTNVDIEVCSNDFDAEGDNFEITGFTQALNGTIIYNDDCTFTYIPNEGFTGDDVFTYTICDDGNPQACDEAVVIITVQEQPDNSVVANNDSDETSVNTAVDIDVFNNDFDPQGDNFDVTDFTQPNNGTVVYNNDGTFTYTPDTDFFGTDVFTYTICDDGNPQACDDAVVTITIPMPDNDVVANDDAETTLPDTPVTIDILTNDFDPQGDTFTITVVDDPSNGTVTQNPDGTVTYLPDPGFTGTDVFTYTICDDGVPQACDDAVVIITIEQLDNNVVAIDDNATTDQNTSVTIDILTNDFDPEGNDFTITVVDDPQHGTVVENPDGTVTYIPDPDYVGTDVFTYTICDDASPTACDEATVTITIDPVDNTVTANDDEISIETDTPAIITVCSNDFDAEGDNFTVSTFTQAVNGTVVYNDDCTFTYIPNENFTGTDTFTYTVCDDGNPQACDEATVTITVTPNCDANPIQITSGIDCSNNNANNPAYQVIFFVNGGVGSYTYEVHIPSTGETLIGNTDGTTPTMFSVPEGELYELVVMDAVGCTATQTDIQTCSPTPVELLSFEGEVQTEGNFLQWISASEINNDFYTLQHATDGINFTNIATLDGNGNTTTTHTYHYLHKEAPAGLSYYRLLQTDFDGTTSEVATITLLRGEVKLGIVGIYPVPATNIANISFVNANSETITIRSYDVAGRLVGTQTFNANKGLNVAQLDVTNYAVGVYFITLQSGNEIQTVRMVKE